MTTDKLTDLERLTKMVGTLNTGPRSADTVLSVVAIARSMAARIDELEAELTDVQPILSDEQGAEIARLVVENVGLKSELTIETERRAKAVHDRDRANEVCDLAQARVCELEDEVRGYEEAAEVRVPAFVEDAGDEE